ncbi:maleylpyruvate isomerase family mycothiol-dependent enzyme [Nocardia thraciensis]
MDPDLIRTWVCAERLALADYLDGLPESEWSRRSLCDGWTVHEVLAHVTMSNRDTLWGTIAGIVRARLDWNRMTAVQATERAARFTPAELIAQLREGADLHRRAPGAGVADLLVDIIVHGQDIARPVGRTLHSPPERVVVALDQVLGSRFYGAPQRVRGMRLTATDADWTYGEGAQEVRGPVIDHLLRATGRPLDGPGEESA